MFTKILLVTMFILLSWNSFHFSKSNEFLRHQIKQLSENDQSIEELIVENKKILKEHSESLNANAQLLASNQKLLNENANKDKKTITLQGLKALTDKIQVSVNKQAISLTENKKSLTTNQKLLVENKKNIIEIKKTAYKVSDQLNKHSKRFAKHSHTKVKTDITSNHSVKNIGKPIYKKEYDKKPKVKKRIALSDSTLLKQLAIEFYKTDQFHSKKELDKALIQISKLKAEVWKSRNIKNIPRELVMSILSSIDITKNKWTNKEVKYSLEKVEEKINLLFSKLGFQQ